MAFNFSSLNFLSANNLKKEKMTWLEQRVSQPVRGLDLNELGLDEAYLNVSSRSLNQTTWLYSLRAACIQVSVVNCLLIILFIFLLF
jgi:hypothetical protein